MRSKPPPAPPPSFDERVARVVDAIPQGKTRSYGEVALLVGSPGGARAVVQALGRQRELPWWRVIRSDGSIAEQMLPHQADLLIAEGHTVIDGRVRGARRRSGGLSSAAKGR